MIKSIIDKIKKHIPFLQQDGGIVEDSYEDFFSNNLSNLTQEDHKILHGNVSPGGHTNYNGDFSIGMKNHIDRGLSNIVYYDSEYLIYKGNDGHKQYFKLNCDERCEMWSFPINDGTGGLVEMKAQKIDRKEFPDEILNRIAKNLL